MAKKAIDRLKIACATWILITGTAIAEGPGVIKMDEDTLVVAEGAGSVGILVERSQGDTGEVSVTVSTFDGSASAGSDYIPFSTVLSWPDGDDSTKSVQLEILGDSDPEGSEDLSVRLSSVTGGATIHPERGETQVIISDNGNGGGNGGGDDDEAGTLKFDQRTFFASEAGGLAIITVERSHGETGAITVDFATSDGTATNGQDYQGTSGTLAWQDGEENSKTFAIEILPDGQQEGDETVQLALFNATGGAEVDGERGTAVLSIADSASNGGGTVGGAGEFEFDPEIVQSIEGSGQATVRVERSDGTQGAVSVSYATSEGSATSNLDYIDVAGTLHWNDGEGGSKEFVVPLLSDDLLEGNETIHLSLSNPIGGAVLDSEDSHGTLVLLDDDGSTESCAADDTTACLEGNRFATRVVWRTRDGRSGQGRANEVGDSSALFTFFSGDNVELIVKVLDGCGVRGLEGYWVFTAGLTNVDYTLEVTDTRTGLVKQYSNLLGEEALPVQDVFTFRSCD